MSAPEHEDHHDLYKSAREYLIQAEGELPAQRSGDQLLALAGAYADMAVYRRLDELEEWLEVIRDRLEGIEGKLGDGGTIVSVLHSMNKELRDIELGVTNLDK